MAELVRFEQDPDAPEGAGVFHFDSGAKQYAYEPQMAAQVSKVKGALDAAPDQRTAQNDAPQPFKISGLAGQIHDQARLGEQRQLADIGGTAVPQDQAVIDRANAAVSGALAKNAAQQMPPPGPPNMQDVAGQARDVMAQRAAEDIMRGTKRQYVAGSPGVDPHKMIQQGVMVPHSSSTVTESAGPYDPEQAQARIGAASKVYESQMADLDLQRMQTENQLNSQRALAPKLKEAADTAQANYDRLQASYRVDRSRLQEDMDHYDKTAHVNPDKYFEDRGLFATLGLAVAQAMGAYASTMTGAPNFAFQIVQNGIDRDIASQREQIESGRVSRRNKMAQMMDNYGYDLNQAESALRIAMNKSLGTQAEMFANESKLPHYQVEAQKLTALTNQQILENEQKFQAASIGKQTRTENDQFLQPKAATGGGYIEKPLTPEEYAARAKLLPTAEKPADFSSLSPEAQVSTLKGYGETKTKLATQRQAADEWAAAMRDKAGKPLRIDWQRGELINSDGKPVAENELDVPGQSGSLPFGSDSITNREAIRAYNEATARVLQAKGQLAFGAATPEQIESLRPSTIGNGEKGAHRSILSLIRATTDQERGLESQYPGAVQAIGSQREREVNVRRKTAGAPVKVSDY